MKFMQHQKTRSEQKEVEEQETPTEVNEQSAQVTEEAECCLADIDELLKDCESRELTDEEILAKGEPDAKDYGYNGTFAHVTDHTLWDYAGYSKDSERYDNAYENVYGVEIRRCGCG